MSPDSEPDSLEDDLTVWLYDSAMGAAAGEVRLKDLQQQGAVKVVDAVTVTWVPGAHQPRIGHLRHDHRGRGGPRLGARRAGRDAVPRAPSSGRRPAPASVPSPSRSGAAASTTASSRSSRRTSPRGPRPSWCSPAMPTSTSSGRSWSAGWPAATYGSCTRGSPTTPRRRSGRLVDDVHRGRTAGRSRVRPIRVRPSAAAALLLASWPAEASGRPAPRCRTDQEDR